MEVSAIGFNETEAIASVGLGRGGDWLLLIDLGLIQPTGLRDRSLYIQSAQVIVGALR